MIVTKEEVKSQTRDVIHSAVTRRTLSKSAFFNAIRMPQGQPASRRNQPQISSFFVQSSVTKKRALVSSHSPIDLTIDDSGSDSGVEKQPPIKKLKSKHPESPTSQWRFDASSRRENSYTTSIQHHKSRSRVDLERILLGTSGHPEDRENSSVDGDSSQDGNDSDPAFTQLRAMFSLPTKGGRKSREKPVVRKTKAAAEVGPSGETYTPYEAQVCREE